MRTKSGNRIPIIQATADVEESAVLGAGTTVWHLAQKLSIPMPISEQVAMVLHHGKHLEEAAKGLMERPLREELDDEGKNPSS